MIRVDGPRSIAVAATLLLAASCQGNLGGSDEASSGSAANAPAPPPEPAPATWGDPAEREDDPGRTTIRRLTNLQFDRTLHDLLKTDLSLGHTLPPNNSMHGFDNNAEAQNMGVLHVENFESALDALVADGMRPPVTTETTLYQPEDPAWSGGLVENCGFGSWPFAPGVCLWFGGTHSTTLTIEHTGPYTLRMRVCQGHGTVDPILQFKVDNVTQAEWVVTANNCKQPEEVTATIHLEAGLRDIGLHKPSQEGTKKVAIDWVQLTGPLDADGALPPGRSKHYLCDPDPEGQADTDCAEQIIRRFMAEAWRRPVTDQEVGRIMATFYAAHLPIPNADPNAPPTPGLDVHTAIQFAFKRVLWSPWFLFRVEVPDDPDSTAPQPLSAHELATRLSYFLWSTQPDAALREAANDGTLLEDDVLEAHTRRMLLDPKAEVLIEDFAGQWLGLTALYGAAPDPEVYPDFDEELRGTMANEIRALARRILLEDRSMLEIFTADERWVEPRLATHYGLQASEPGFMSVPGREQSGLLTSAGILTATSNPTRSSPVRRGYWILSHMLCEEPPPPPDGVEQDLDKPGEVAGTPAEQLATHRDNPQCASCHDQLDPIGLALEGFNGIGQSRLKYDDGSPIEFGGTLPGVGDFDNVQQLAAALAQQPRAGRCMVQKAMTYALGRGLRGTDWPLMKPVEAQFIERGHRFEDLVIGIVKSPLFRFHRGGQ